MPLRPQIKQRLSFDKYVPLVVVILLFHTFRKYTKHRFFCFRLEWAHFSQVHLSTSLYLPYAHSVLADGQLYAGVYIDFMGTDSAIFRTLGKHTAMRTDQYNSRWLHGTHKIFEPWRSTKKKFFCLVEQVPDMNIQHWPFILPPAQ